MYRIGISRSRIGRDIGERLRSKREALEIKKKRKKEKGTLEARRRVAPSEMTDLSEILGRQFILGS